MPGGFAKGLIHRRRMLVGQLWLRGNSERTIAEMVRIEASKPDSLLKRCEKTTHITVHNDIVACRDEWARRDGRKLDDKRTEQISRLLDIVHQAWVDFTNKADYLRPQYLRIALEAEEKLAKIMGTLAPVKLAGAEGEPLIPPIVRFHFANGTVIKPPRNGDRPEAEIVSIDGNGDNSA